MIHRSRVFTVLVLGILAAWVLLPAAQGLQGTGIDCKFIGDSHREVERHWTKERMAAAEPLPLLDLSGEDFHILLDPEPRPWISQDQPWPADVSKWPFRTAGRLFFTVGKKDKWCTAELTGTGQTLLTAAHCVRSGKSKDKGAWHSNFCFVRAYQKGGGQSMKLQRVATWKSWVGNMIPNYNFDYAIFSTADSSKVGWLGLSSPLWYSSWTSIGYPKSYGEGEVMYRVLGWRDHIEKGLVAMGGNPMDAGSSGGAWIRSSATGRPGSHAVGLNSFRYNGLMYGPLFDHQTAFLLSYVANGCR